VHRTLSKLGAARPTVQVTHTRDLLGSLPTASVDLLVTNPPYIPEYDPASPNPYGGTAVLEDMLLGNGPRVLSPHGAMILLYSSLSERAMKQYLERTSLVSIPLGEPRRVPLDLREVVGDPRWMLHLKDHGLEEEPEALD
jgi:methylase of polypeptide subunit release factors